MPTSTVPKYPDYLPTRPEGYVPAKAIAQPFFEADERALHADTSLPEFAQAQTFDITPAIGTELSGVQISNLTPEGLDQLALLAAERGVLVFRNQDFADIGPQRQKDIAGHFGPLHAHTTMGFPKGTGPEFQVVYADEKVGSLRDVLGSHTTYDLWHVDQTFTPNVPSTTLFWVLESPPTGGDTAFTSLTAAYAALSPAYRETLLNLELEHSSASTGEVARLGLERALEEAVTTHHPLVIEHPVTKKPVLFVNPAQAKRVVGFKPEESEHLLSFLHSHIRSLDFSCRVRWEPGTVVVWDQRSTAHSAVPDFAKGSRRHMIRLLPYGSKPRAAKETTTG